MFSARYFYPILTTISLRGQILLQLSTLKFHINPFRCSRVVTYAQMEGQVDKSILMGGPQGCEHAYRSNDIIEITVEK
jgi:hypothetical protein